MSQGHLQLLSSKSIQNQVLTTVSKVVTLYKAKSNFVICPKEIKIHGNANFGKFIDITIPRVADLLYKTYIYVKLPALDIPSGSTYCGWTNSLCHTLFKQVDLYIGEQVIASHRSDFFEIESEISEDANKQTAYNSLTGKFTTYTDARTSAAGITEYYLPLKFWFCESVSQALPLNAIKYQEVTFRIYLRDFQECVTYDGSTAPTAVDITDLSLIADMILLDANESRYISDSDHIFTIKQVQYTESIYVPSGTSKKNIQIPFNNNVSRLSWFFIESDSIDNNDFYNWSVRVDNSKFMDKCSIVVEGIELITEQPEVFFRLLQGYSKSKTVSTKPLYNYIFVDSDNESFKGSTLNFSKTDSVILRITFKSGIPACYFRCIGINFNVFKIQKGLCGVLFTV